MPDADDFDVEYFRNLLRGGPAKKEEPAKPKPAAKIGKKAPPAARRAAAGGKSAPAAKKPKKSR